MGIPTTYDNIFDAYRGPIPKEYLRALAFVQSGMNPSKSIGNSAGLFMISVPALEAFDKKYPGAFPPEPHKPVDLAKPDLNSAVAIWITDNITKYFATKYPKTMSKNWNSPTYVALVTLGFLTGYTEPNGIGRAIKEFEEKDPTSLSLENVAAMSKKLGLSESKYDPKVVAKAKAVANAYVVDTGGKAVSSPLPHASPSAQPFATKKGSGAMIALLAIPAVAFLAFRKK